MMNTRLYTLLINSMLIASVVVLVAASVSCIAPRYPKRMGGWEDQAKSTLRAFGETEMAYQYTSGEDKFGTFEDLIQTDYLASGYSRGDIIENYSVWIGVYNQTFSATPWVYGNTFTIVAFPRITRPPGYLHTFAIREDQVLRMYNPEHPGINAWGQNDDFGTRTWEPIR